MTDQKQFATRRYKLLFGIRRSVRYHDHRRRHYLTVHSRIIFLIILLGSSAFAAILRHSEIAALVAAAIVSILAALDLVLDTTAHAALHTNLCKQFGKLEQRFLQDDASSETITAQLLDNLERERIEIELDELPIYRAVDRLCHNELLYSEGRSNLEKRLKPHHLWFKDWCHFNDMQMEQHNEAT